MRPGSTTGCATGSATTWASARRRRCWPRCWRTCSRRKRGGARNLAGHLGVGMTAADPPRILLVEDDPALSSFLVDNLHADGFVPLLAGTMADGLRMLEFKQPDLVLVDLGLPDGSGLDLIARVRAADGIATRLDPATP